jgi:FAD/FMN-containing dehydrogenase
VPADATAFGWRDAGFSVVALGADDDALTRAFEPLRALGRGMYPAFETALGDDVVARAFPPATLARLRALKRRYDPTALFRDNMPITPAELATDPQRHEAQEALR